MDPDHMGKYVISLLAILVLVAIPSAVAQARPTDRSAHAAALYPIPSAPGSSRANAAGPAAAYLATLSPKALAETGGPKLRARASGPGTFTFLLSAEIHGKTVVIGTGSKTTGRAGAITVKVTFTKAGKAALISAKGKLHITVTAIFKPKRGKNTTARRTVTLK
jgi:hypothetical protein